MITITFQFASEKMRLCGDGGISFYLVTGISGDGNVDGIVSRERVIMRNYVCEFVVDMGLFVRRFYETHNIRSIYMRQDGDEFISCIEEELTERVVYDKVPISRTDENTIIVAVIVEVPYYSSWIGSKKGIDRVQVKRLGYSIDGCRIYHWNKRMLSRENIKKYMKREYEENVKRHVTGIPENVLMDKLKHTFSACVVQNAWKKYWYKPNVWREELGFCSRYMLVKFGVR